MEKNVVENRKTGKMLKKQIMAENSKTQKNREKKKKSKQIRKNEQAENCREKQNEMSKKVVKTKTENRNNSRETHK